MMNLYHQTALGCSKLITQAYSTSFTLGIQTLHKRFHLPIYAIYGFVRYADEIVDTFHDFDKEKLLREFWAETHKALDQGVSLNPVLHSFQMVVNQYAIDRELIDAFMRSMEMDLYRDQYDPSMYKEYIYGSAEVVGLMCLKVFVEGDQARYDALKEPARALGSAFQKVNFLRDMKSDYVERGRVYFPGVDYEQFDSDIKRQIEADIQADFDAAYEGIMRLPTAAKLGVYLAYTYYLRLFGKIKRADTQKVLSERIRIPNARKFALLLSTYAQYRLNII